MKSRVNSLIDNVVGDDRWVELFFFVYWLYYVFFVYNGNLYIY